MPSKVCLVRHCRLIFNLQLIVTEIPFDASHSCGSYNSIHEVISIF